MVAWVESFENTNFKKRATILTFQKRNAIVRKLTQAFDKILLFTMTTIFKSLDFEGFYSGNRLRFRRKRCSIFILFM